MHKAGFRREGHYYDEPLLGQMGMSRNHLVIGVSFLEGS